MRGEMLDFDLLYALIGSPEPLALGQHCGGEKPQGIEQPPTA